MYVYILDVTTFVEREVSQEIIPVLHSSDLIKQMYATPRKRVLDRWINYKFPLSYSEGTLTDLIYAISDHCKDNIRIVNADIRKQSLSFFVQKLIAVYKPDVLRRQASFI